MNLVEYLIQFKEKGVSSSVGKAKRAVDGLDDSIVKTNKSLGLGTVAAAAAAAVGVFKFVNASLDAFDKQAQAENRVRQGLISTRGAAQRTFNQLTQMANDLQKTSLYSDADILQGVTSQLLTFTKVTGASFDRAQAAAIGYSTVLGGSLSASAAKVGKALEAPEQGIVSLTKSGVRFNAEQIKTIQRFSKANDLGGAQNVILMQLEKQFRGAAAAAAAAGTGPIKQLFNRFSDLREVVGAALIPIINFFIRIINSLLSVIDNNNSSFTALIQTVTFMVASVAVLIGVIKAWAVIQTVINFLLTANPIGLIIVAVGALVFGIIKLYKSSETFRGILSGLFSVLNTIWQFIKQRVIQRFNELQKVFGSTGSSITEFLQKPIDFAIASFMNFIGLLEKIPGVGGLVKNLRESFSKGFRDGVKDFRREQEKTSLDASLSGGGFGTSGRPPVTGAGAGAGGPTDVVRNSAPKIFNINIESLVERIELQVTNLTEGTAEVKDAINAALLEALADISLPR